VIRQQLTKHLCDENPQYATAEVFKEFLVGSCYQAMKNQQCDSHILKSLPISSIIPFPDPVSEEVRSLFYVQSSVDF